MTSPTDDRAAASELPPAIGSPALQALAQARIVRYGQLADRTERELLALHGVGPKAIRILREELLARGLTFRPA